jgi:hypothetical protein
MGKGSIGNLASAATVAASSFDMRVCDPRLLLDRIDRECFYKMLNIPAVEVSNEHLQPIVISEPEPELCKDTSKSALPDAIAPIMDMVDGRIQRFGDHVDTDGTIIPTICLFL